MSSRKTSQAGVSAKTSHLVEPSIDTPTTKLPSKLEQLEALLTMPSGTTLLEMVAATGWQQHSVRGAIAGALKKRGLSITSDKVDGVRRYRGTRA